MAAHISPKNKVAAVILAAGKSKRTGFIKQFIKINKKPLFFYSLKKFIESPLIDSIVVVLPKKTDFSLVDKKQLKINAITGGATRTISVSKALDYIKKSGLAPDYVIIHDAARPMLTHAMIESVLAAAKKDGAAAMGVRAIDTVVEGSGLYIASAPNKDLLYYTYTPHCYKLDLLRNAHKIGKKNKNYKDLENIHLLLNSGRKIKIVEGHYPNIKLTYPGDLPIIESFLKHARK